MKQGLSLRVSQHLTLTPQLQQSIRLLQLSTLELNQEIEQMLDDNPFLETETDELQREEFGLTHANTSAVSEDSDDADDGQDLSQAAEMDQSWDGDGSTEINVQDSEWGGDAPPARQDKESAADLTEWNSSQDGLAEHLLKQALALRLNEVDRAALRYLIENLNDDGYLEDSLDELAIQLMGGPPQDEEHQDMLDELRSRLNQALLLLQHMEPVGVGARSLAECMALQVKGLTSEDAPKEVRDLALQLCQQPLEWLAKRDLKRLASVVGGNEQDLKTALALLARLEPKPGRPFVQVEHQIVVPDVIVTRIANDRMGQARFKVMLNVDVMPRLRVHDIYANALKGAGKNESMAGLQQRLQEARWFIKNIQQRFDTILRVSQAIAQRQRNFFLHGELAMKPMVLREIADELGLHESTISRVTTAKYMATPMGTFELKYFFGSGLDTQSGSSASSTAVRALIKQFIASENTRKPLSDHQLSAMLKEQGIDCARRTVAKYREGLRIPSTNLRKVL
jgi:RNA polymerase sigma-54 factor